MSKSRSLLDRSLWPAVILLAFVFALFELTPLDLWVQDHLYDFDNHQWLVDAKAKTPRLFFYNLPKALLFFFGFSLLVICGVRGSVRDKILKSRFRRVELWVVFLTMLTAPILISTSKATTNVFCPKDIRRYGGEMPYVRVCESYPENDHPKKRGRGFPAGHASGGFALLSLAGLARTRRGMAVGIAIGIGMGGMMGIYQMLKGAHYLSHTLITAIFCWVIFLAWRRICHRHELKSASC